MVNDNIEVLINNLATDIFDSLIEMDNEADKVINEVRTGLVDYAGFKGIKTKCYEIPIYRRLEELLNDAGYNASADRSYPDSTNRKCDLTIKKDDSLSCWLEVKVIWREWLSTDTGKTKTADFKSYVLGPGPGRLPRSHSLAQDFKKLETIGPDDGTHLAVLAICFDSIKRSLNSTINKMSKEQCLIKRGWRQFGPETWRDQNSNNHRIVCYLWFRNAKERSEEQPKSNDSASEVSLSHLYSLVTDPITFEEKATKLLRSYLPTGNEWKWEEWIAELTSLPLSHPLVTKIGKIVRNDEKPYRVENYIGNPIGEERVTIHLLQYIRREINFKKQSSN